MIIPDYLYKVVSENDWQTSRVEGKVKTSSIDTEFVHLAKEEQLAHVISKFWTDKEYVVLKLNTKKLVGRLIYETNPGGTTHYYHLYGGQIPLDAIIKTKKIEN